MSISKIPGIGDLWDGLTGQTGADAAKDAANAQSQASAQQLQFLRQLLGVQLDVSRPQRAIGNQAFNQLAQLYGMQSDAEPTGSIALPWDSSTLPQPGEDVVAQLRQQAQRGGTFGPQDEARYDKLLLEWQNKQPKKIGTPTQNLPSSAQAGIATQAGAGAPAAQAPNFSGFFESPDYQFALQQGNKAIDRSAAARGTLYSGGQLQALSNYNQGLATQNYNNYLNQLNTLAGLGSNGNNNSLNALSSIGSGITNVMGQQGNNAASSYINQANAQQQGIGNLLSLGGLAGGLFALSDRRLKSNIERIGTHKSGLPWYRYEINGRTEEGVMADEVYEIRPDAVRLDEDNGVLMVDYAALEA